jgi:26S proteasome regulatory subunit N9
MIIWACASSKLWHQATLALEELVKDPVFNAAGNKDLLTLYNDLVKDQPPGSQWSGFGSRMNAVKHAALAIRVSKQHGDAEADIEESISFLEAVGTKVTSDKEALLLLRLEIARRTLQAGRVEEAKEKLEACKAVLADFAELDSSVNSAYYRVSALLQKTLGEAGEFYTCSLLYLAYTPLDLLGEEEKQALAFDLGLAALCAEKLYQFGELLLHPILKCLEGTRGEWLVTMLNAFNMGDIAAFEKVSAESAAAINQQPALVGNAQRLREKIRIFALLEQLRDIPPDCRVVSFQAIADRTKLPVAEVELLLMKSLSLNLVKGVISGVDSNVRVTWVHPRVMDRESIAKQVVYCVCRVAGGEEG